MEKGHKAVVEHERKWARSRECESGKDIQLAVLFPAYTRENCQGLCTRDGSTTALCFCTTASRKTESTSRTCPWPATSWTTSPTLQSPRLPHPLFLTLEGMGGSEHSSSTLSVYFDHSVSRFGSYFYAHLGDGSFPVPPSYVPTSILFPFPCLLYLFS